MIPVPGLNATRIDRLGYLDGRRVYGSKPDSDLIHARRQLRDRQRGSGYGQYEAGVLRAIEDLLEERKR